MTKIIYIGAILGTAILASNNLSAATIQSTFDSGSEGWVQLEINSAPNTYNILNTFSVGFSSTGGNPGGHIWDTDPSANGWSFGASSAYLGNKSTFVGGNIAFDLSTTPSAPPNQGAHLWLRSTSLLLLFSDPSGAPATSFTHYEVSLSPDAGWSASPLDSSGMQSGPFVPATNSDFVTVLSNLTSVEVRGDWVNGNETSRLDNFSMSAVPVPAALWLFGSGLIGLIGVARRKSRV